MDIEREIRNLNRKADNILRILNNVVTNMDTVSQNQEMEIVMDAATQAAVENLNTEVASVGAVDTEVETDLQTLTQHLKEAGEKTEDPAVAAAIGAAAESLTAATQKLKTAAGEQTATPPVEAPAAPATPAAPDGSGAQSGGAAAGA